LHIVCFIKQNIYKAGKATAFSLQNCCFGQRKGNWSIKKLSVGTLMVVLEVRSVVITAISISKIQEGSTFWYQLTQSALENGR